MIVFAAIFYCDYAEIGVQMLGSGRSAELREVFAQMRDVAATAVFIDSRPHLMVRVK